MNTNQQITETEDEGKSLNFIEQIIEEEIAAGKNGGKVHMQTVFVEFEIVGE